MVCVPRCHLALDGARLQRRRDDLLRLHRRIVVVVDDGVGGGASWVCGDLEQSEKQYLNQDQPWVHEKKKKRERKDYYKKLNRSKRGNKFMMEVILN